MAERLTVELPDLDEEELPAGPNRLTVELPDLDEYPAKIAKTTGPEGFAEHAEQALLRFGAGFAESVAESGLQLAEVIPSPYQKKLQQRFPAGQTNFVKYLEEAGILQQAGLVERLAQGTGEVAAFFLPVTKATMILNSLRFVQGAGRVGRIGAQFLPLGIGTYAAMKSQADAEGRSLERGEVGLAAAQVLGAMFVGKAGEAAARRALARVPERLRETLTRHASNAALGAAMEGTGAWMQGENWREAAVEGALGSIIGAYAAYKLPGGKIRTAKEAEVVAKQVSEGLERAALHQDTPSPEVQAGRPGLLRRPTFASSDRQKMLREASMVDSESWPDWMVKWVEKRLPTGSDAALTADYVKYGRRRMFKSKELAKILFDEGSRGPAGKQLTTREAREMVAAIEMKLGIPPAREQEAFKRWVMEMSAKEAAGVEKQPALRAPGDIPVAEPRAPKPARAAIRKPGEPVIGAPPTQLRGEPALGAPDVLRGPPDMAGAQAYLQKSLKGKKLRALGTPSSEMLQGMFNLSSIQAEALLRRHELGARVQGAASTGVVVPAEPSPPPPPPLPPRPIEAAYQQILPATGGPPVAGLVSPKTAKAEASLQATAQAVQAKVAEAAAKVREKTLQARAKAAGVEVEPATVAPAVAPAVPSAPSSTPRAARPKKVALEAIAEGEEPVPVRITIPEGFAKGEGFATPREAEAAARTWDAAHLDAPPAAIVKVKDGYRVYTPEPKQGQKFQRSPEEVAKEQKAKFEKEIPPAEPEKSRAARIAELEERLSGVNAKLGTKLPPAERSVLQGIKTGLSREAALEREMLGREGGRAKLSAAKKAGLITGVGLLGAAALGGRAEAEQTEMDKLLYGIREEKSTKRKVAEGIAIGAGVMMAGRAIAKRTGPKIDFKDMAKGREELARAGEEARQRVRKETTQRLEELADGMTTEDALEILRSVGKTRLAPVTEQMKMLKRRFRAKDEPRELSEREQVRFVDAVLPFEMEAQRRGVFRKAAQQAAVAESRKRGLGRRETEALQKQFEQHEVEMASMMLEGYAAKGGATPKELGAVDRFVWTVQHVIETKFGEFGKYLAPVIGRVLRSADMRGGVIEQQMKQIRMPGKKLATLGDALTPKEHKSAAELRDYWVAKLEKMPAEWLPPDWPKTEPKARNEHVRTIVHGWVEYYYGHDIGGSAAVKSTSKQIQGFFDKLFPSMAQEAGDLDIQIVGHDGKVYPFLERLGPNKKYIPLILGDYAMTVEPSKMAKFPELSKHWAEKAATAGRVQRIIAEKIAAKYGITTGEAHKRMLDVSSQRHMPLLRWSVDSTVKKAGHLEMSRFIDSVIGSEVDFARIVRAYARPAIMRFEYANAFGRSGFLLNEMIRAADQAGYKPAQFKEFLDLALEQAPELRSTGMFKDFVREWGAMQGIAKLGGSGIAQLTSVPTLLRALSVYSRNPVRAANWQAFFRGFDEAVTKTMVDLNLEKSQIAKVRALLVSDTGALIEAERVNWMAQLGGLFPKLQTVALHMYGTIPIDRFIRNWAGAAGRAQADILAYEYAKAVKKNSRGDIRELEFHFKDLGIFTQGATGELNPRRDFPNWDSISSAKREEYRNLIGWTIAYRTQHRTRPYDLPKSASSEFGRYLYRFSSFAIRQTAETARQVRSEILDPRPGESKANYISRTLKWVASLVPAGVAALYIGRLRALIAEPDDARRHAKAQADPTFDKIVNLITYANIAPWAFDWIESASRPGGIATRMIGPVYGSMIEAGEYSIPALYRGDPGPGLRYLTRVLGVPGISGQSGTWHGRLLGVPSGREIVDRGAEIKAANVPFLRDVSLGRVQTAPGIGPFMRKPKPGHPSYGEVQLRTKHPAMARLLLGREPAKQGR